MAGFADQLPALVGVAIGATASYLISAANDRARWRRGQSARWDERRAEAYADYAYAVKVVYTQALRIANARGLGPGPQREITDLDAAIAELGRLGAERTAKWELVLLLGDPETIAAGRTWHRHIGLAERYAHGERTDPSQYAEIRAAIDADRGRFYTAARHDLGIRSGDIPHAGPWEWDTPNPQPHGPESTPEHQPA